MWKPPHELVLNPNCASSARGSPESKSFIEVVQVSLPTSALSVEVQFLFCTPNQRRTLQSIQWEIPIKGEITNLGLNRYLKTIFWWLNTFWIYPYNVQQTQNIQYVKSMGYMKMAITECSQHVHLSYIFHNIFFIFFISSKSLGSCMHGLTASKSCKLIFPMKNNVLLWIFTFPWLQKNVALI